MIISVLIGCSAIAKVFSMVSRSLSGCQCVSVAVSKQLLRYSGWFIGHPGCQGVLGGC